MRLMIILIAFCMIRESLQKVEFHEEKITPVSRIMCVKIAIKTYSEYNWDMWIFSTTSTNYLNGLFKFPVFLITDWDLLGKTLPEVVGTVVIFLEGNAGDDLNGLKHLQGVDTMSSVLIVCIADVVCGSEMYMTKILEVITSVELRYVALDEHGIINIYEHTTRIEGRCGIAQLLRRGHCSDKSTAKKVFSTSMNFQKCPIRVVTWPCPTYSILCDFENPSNWICGLAGHVIEVVAEQMNATPVSRLVDNPEIVRQIVANREADLGFGELDNRAFEGVMYSKPYMFVQATILAPKSTWILKQSAVNILKPLNDEVWAGIGVVIVSIFVLRRLVPHFQKIQALQLFGIFLAIPVPRTPRRFSSRIFFLSLVIFAYLCSRAYLSNLTKVLSTPRLQKIKTLNDLENSKLRVVGIAASRERFKDDYPRIYRDFQVLGEWEYYLDIVDLLEGRSNSAYYIEDFDKHIAQRKAVEALHERINWFPVSLVAPNTSTTLKTIDKILGYIMESGIVSVYETFTSSANRRPKSQEPPSSEISVDIERNEFQRVFILLIGGLALSFFVFCIEIMTPFMKKKRIFKERSKIHPKLSTRQRYIHGIMIPRQTFRVRVDVE